MCLSCSTHIKHAHVQLPSPTCQRSFTSLNEYPFHLPFTPRTTTASESDDSLSPPPPPPCQRFQISDNLSDAEVPMFLPKSQSLIRDDDLKKRGLGSSRCLEKTLRSSTFRLKPRPSTNSRESSTKLPITINAFPILPFPFEE